MSLYKHIFYLTYIPITIFILFIFYVIAFNNHEVNKQEKMLQQLKHNREEEFQKVKSGEIKKCTNCEYSTVLIYNGEYDGTLDCQNFYINSHTLCNTGNYKYKFEDDWSNDEVY